ncbi:MAG: helix-turn-helix transcriptional regulator [Clostridia bacterium]|nr:helix-turn-helix transcriptional regulator [Clostridia bacterium]
MPEDCSRIIDRLIEERHNRGMTQKELAEATKLTQSVIARFESKKATPQLDTLLKVTQALECELEIVSLK